jgi:threonine-phosphate decarboxylase
MDLDSLRRKHGGYWRYPHLDFHYLFNQYFPPPELYRELQSALLDLANRYPSSQDVLADLLVEWKKETHLTADRVVVGNGSSELIKLLMDRVITRITVPLPTFNEFTIASCDRIHRYALEEASGFTLDVDRLLYEIARSHSDYAAIVNPNNPVGWLLEVDDVQRIVETGVCLIVDEAFMAFTDGRHSAERLIETHPNLIVVTSLTKSIGIAGLRLGYALTSNADVRKRLRDALPIWNVNSLAEYVLEALPRYRAAHAESIARVRADTQWFAESLLAVPYLQPFPTHANAVFCRVLGDARRLAELLFERHGFVIKDGVRQAELTPSGSYVRMGVRNRDDNTRLLAALHAITADDIVFQPASAGESGGVLSTGPAAV